MIDDELDGVVGFVEQQFFHAVDEDVGDALVSYLVVVVGWWEG